MLCKEKTDIVLGKKIHEHLLSLGVETPLVSDKVNPERQEIVQTAIKNIMAAYNLDLSDDSLRKTPYRIAKMVEDELFWGLDYGNFPKITVIENKMQYNSMLHERNIKVVSLCEHHLLPIIGTASIAYIPREKVVGLSKLNRLTEFFSRRPQVQERLCEQIFHTLCYVLETEDVAVYIKANHSCVRVRGVEDINSDTITTRLGGIFFEGVLRNEFYHTIGL